MMIPLVTSPAYNKAIISSITALIPSSTVPNTVCCIYLSVCLSVCLSAWLSIFICSIVETLHHTGMTVEQDEEGLQLPYKSIKLN